MQSLAFSAQNENGGPIEGCGGVKFGPALVQSVNPKAALLELFKGLVDVRHPDDGKMFDGSGSRLSDCFGKSRGAPLRNDNSRCSCGVCGANNSAEIVRIFNAV